MEWLYVVSTLAIFLALVFWLGIPAFLHLYYRQLRISKHLPPLFLHMQLYSETFHAHKISCCDTPNCVLCKGYIIMINFQNVFLENNSIEEGEGPVCMALYE